MAENQNSPDPFGIAEGHARTEQYEQPERDEKLVASVLQLYSHADRSRQSLDTDWGVYLSYLLGDQMLFRDAATQTIVRVVDLKKRRLWSFNNQLSAINRAFVGKLTSSRPTFYCRPGSGGQDEVLGARVADRFIEFFTEKESLGNEYDAAIGDIGWAGLGILSLYWDPQAGRCLGHCAVCGLTDEGLPDGAPCPFCGGGLTQKVYEGDLKVRRLDPRSVYVQPGVERAEDLQWVIVRRAVPVTLARKMFPQHALHLHAESDMYPAHGARYTYNATSGIWDSDEMQDHLFLYEYHEKASGLHPKGRVLFIANRILLEEKESPYSDCGRLPFFFLPWEQVPGRFYPVPPIANAWHRQKELNENETQIREHVELTTRTKIINPIGSRIASDEITAATAQVLMPHPQVASEIRYLNPPMLPTEVFQRGQMLISDIRSMFGVTANESNMPMDPNGRVMAIAENESDRSIGHIVRRHHKELAELFRCALIICKRFYSPDRKFALMGDDGLEVYSFQDLNFSPGMSIAIEAEDGLSKNQAVRLQEVANLAQLGFFGPPGMMNTGLMAKAARLKIPGLQPDATDTEVAAAMAAIKKIEDGIPFEPGDEDDAQIFANTILHWLRAHRELKDSKPDFYMQIRQLYQFYIMQLQMAMQAQMQQAAPPGMEQSVPSSDQSAPGGSPNATLDEGTAQSPVVQGANDMIAGADAFAEAAVPASMGP